ncbi:helix-turn-helix domain-containing protein [Acrocarpospora catenulata]|uniref:helix-turn-helix domain-containing protein n=1 Tax=Acrocarpospora catenulata TaxID=2836182 RepID=UPI001BD92227|nr:helix-turn-helix domain-containing protein [Acrocarpospora catenulata]
MRKVDVVLHPVRLRILQAFIGQETMTVKDVAERLSDVPQATLYRHLNTLSDAGVLRVAEERRVRGAVERIYRLPDASTALVTADLEGATPADHLRYFAAFLAALQAEFTHYLGRPRIDLAADGVGYRTATLNLTDEEFETFMTTLNRLVAEATANPEAPGRRRRAFSRIIVPLDEKD